MVNLSVKRIKEIEIWEGGDHPLLAHYALKKRHIQRREYRSRVLTRGKLMGYARKEK
jgi:hypothetical protein